MQTKLVCKDIGTSKMSVNKRIVMPFRLKQVKFKLL